MMYLHRHKSGGLGYENQSGGTLSRRGLPPYYAVRTSFVHTVWTGLNKCSPPPPQPYPTNPSSVSKRLTHSKVKSSMTDWPLA
jgi:hypothetical protein